MLAQEVSAFRPRRLVCLSRGLTEPRRWLPEAEYRQADIRDRAALDRVFDEVRPDVVFHVAAQRNPGLAEIEVHRTLTTNVFGTRNMLAAAAAYEVPDVVVTSTGKALRPYSPDVYTASKRVAEWLARTAAQATVGTERKISASRFTHVADNSIIAQRLEKWCEDGIIRLHSAEIEFYVQSGIEAAQLLIAGGLDATSGMLKINALRNLDWPVNLLDLSLGMIIEKGSDSPIYIAGYEGGYEEIPFPALYDPRTAGDVSPLINAFEAPHAEPGRCCQVDSFEAPALTEDAEVVDRLDRLEDLCARTEDSGVLRPAFDALCLALLDASLRDLPKPALARALYYAVRSTTPIDPAHRPMIDGLKRWLED